MPPVRPTLTVWCPDEGCARYLEEERVPAYVEHDGRVVCRFEDDEHCPECGKLRKGIR